MKKYITSYLSVCVFLFSSLASVGVYAATVTITADTTIGLQSAGDGYINNDIIVDGATVTVSGTHDWASLQLLNGAVLTHPVETVDRLVLNITGDIQVDASSGINVSSRGQGTPAGLSSNAGASHAGLGGLPSSTTGNVAYGSAISPITYGSGGAGRRGGGAVQITAVSMTLDGSIQANGQPALGTSFGGSAGGSVWLDVAAISGSGLISASGGNAGTSGRGGGGGGRVAIYYATLNGFDPLVQVSTNPGQVGIAGGAGTLYIEPSVGAGSLHVRSATGATNTPTPVQNMSVPITAVSATVQLDANATVGMITTTAGGGVIALSSTTAGDVSINAGSLTVEGAFSGGNLSLLNTSQIRPLNIAQTVTDDRPDLTFADVIVDAGSSVNLTGYGSSSGTNQSSNGGASHGGLGGQPSGVTSLASYGDTLSPSTHGTGTVIATRRGGGAFKLTASSLLLDGAIEANGEASSASSFGGASGGSVWLDVGVLSGNGSISANGGAGGSTSRGGGAGGRIAVYYDSLAGFNLDNINAVGSGSSVGGGAGTLYFEDTSTNSGTLVLRNSGAQGITNISGSNPYGLTIETANVDTLDATSFGGNYSQDGGRLSIQNTFEVLGNSTLSNSARIRQRNNDSAIELIFADLSVDASSSISADFQGVMATQGVASGSGASHGGLGGRPGGLLTNASFGDALQPVTSGAGGAVTRGGGAIKLTVADFLLNGEVSADGGSTSSSSFGGASGGSIWINAQTISGTGLIAVDGGNGGASTRGSGGGGRIALYYGNATGFDLGNVRAFGGSLGTPGGAGTVYLSNTSEALATLRVRNSTRSSGETPITGSFAANLDLLDARATTPSALVMSGGLTSDNAVLAVGSSVSFVEASILSNSTRIQQLDVGSVPQIELTFGTLEIDATSTVNVNGQGALSTSGVISSVGISHGGVGGRPSGSATNSTYGSLFEPSDVGSGNNSRGGGAVKISATAFVLNGVVSANGLAGPSSSFGGASGGSIWIDTDSLSGTGSISADGGLAGASTRGDGGGGRVAIYYDTAPGFVFEDQATAYGGNFGSDGGAGTVLYKQNASATGVIRVENRVGSSGTTPLSGTLGHSLEGQSSIVEIIPTAVLSGDLLLDDAELRIGVALSGESGQLTNGARIRQLALADITDPQIELTLNNVEIDSSSSINVNGQGLNGTSGLTSAVGASHAGFGGAAGGSAVNTPYGSLTEPADFGTGSSARGGGSIKLIFNDLTLNGQILANGSAGPGTSFGGGSGGSIWLDVNAISGAGTIQANGGLAGASTRGSGGGGRIAVYFQDASAFDLATQLVASGADFGTSGGAGTVYLLDRAQNQPSVRVRNSTADYARTPLQVVVSADYVVDQAYGELDANASIGTIEVLNGGTLGILDNALATTVRVDDARLGVQGPFAAQTIDLVNGGRLMQTGSASSVNDAKADVQIATLNVDATSTVDVSVQGLQAFPGIISATGGSYGGLGGGSSPIPTFGDETQPLEFGTASSGTRGGGAIKLTISEDLNLFGNIRANGGAPSSTSFGGGSGGAIWLDVNRINGTGSIIAAGGNGGASSRGAGGGGRVALYYQDLTTFDPATQITVPTGTFGIAGEAGTIYLQNFNLPPRVSTFTPEGAVDTAVTSLSATFTTRIDPASIDVSDIVVTDTTNGNVTIPADSVVSNSDFQFDFVFANPLADADYDVSIGPDIANLSGVLMDQDEDTVPGESPDDVFTTTFSVDTAPPVAPTVTSHAALPEEQIVNTLSVTVSGDRSEASAILINGVEVAAQGSGAWSANVTLNEGINNLSIVAADPAGNTSTSIELRFIADTVPPQVTSLSPSGMTNLIPGQIVVNFAADTSGIDQAISVVNVRRNGILLNGTLTYTPTTVSFVPAGGVLEGGYLVDGTLIDRAGNSTPLASLGFTLDYTPPAQPALNAVPSVVQIGLLTVTGTKEPNASLWLNGAQVVGPATPSGFSVNVNLTEGDNILSFVARDNAGNDSPAAVAEVRFDDSAPGPIGISIDPDGDGKSLSLSWIGYDEAANGGDIASYSVYTSPANFTDASTASLVTSTPGGAQSAQLLGLTRGQPVFVAVVAVDAQGNQDLAVSAISATPNDIQAPANVAAINTTNSANSIDLSWTAPGDDDVATYLLSVDGAADIDLGDVTTYTLGSLTAATQYDLVLKVRDVDGNISSGTAGFGVTYLANPAISSSESFNGRVNIDWPAATPSNLVQSYRLYAETVDFTDVSGLTPKLTVPASRLDAGVTGLVNGTPYFLAVQAVNLASGANPAVVTTTATPEADGDGPTLSNHRYAGVALTAATTLTSSGAWQIDLNDESGIARVEFLVDGLVVHTDLSGTSTASHQLDLFSVPDGLRELRVRAIDTLNNETEEAVTVTVALDAPPAPSITEPAIDLSTNETTALIQGTAAQNSQVQVSVGGGAQGGILPVGESGTFSVSITLVEGANPVTAAAEYPGRGGFGTSSSARTITLDSSIPDSPQGLIADAKPMGEVRLDWNAANDVNVAGYHVYRSTTSFNDPSAATRVNGSLLTFNTYTDLLVSDGEYYYRVVAVNQVDTESELSDEVSATADATLPQALEITYTSTGNVDADTGRMAPGSVAVDVEFSETLLTTPYLAIVPNQGVPTVVELIENFDEPTRYTGSFQIEPTTPSGTAFAVISAFDEVGNRGTDVLIGETIEIDTAGPDLMELTVNPASPIQNDPDNVGVGITVEIIAKLNGDVAEGTLPVLIPQIDGVPIPGLESGLNFQLDFQSLPGEPIYTSNFVLPLSAGQDDLGDPLAESLTFAYSADDDLANTSTFINGTNAFQVYQGDLPPLEAPFGLTAEALPNGQIQLNWFDVEGAAGYQIQRQGPTDGSLVPIAVVSGSATQTFIDDGSLGFANVEGNGLQDGIYIYTVASERQQNNQTSYSGPSNTVTATADGTPPSEPENFVAELTGSGVLMNWIAPSSELQSNTVRYRVYRLDVPQGNPIDLTGVTPYQDDIPDVIALDDMPSSTEFTYVITAMDTAGNESAPSAPQYVNADLLPVNQLQLLQPEGAQPVLSWQHQGGAIAGFNVFAGESGNETLLTPTRLTSNETTFVDLSHTSGAERRYSVVAEDTNAQVSLPHEIRLPALTASLADDGNGAQTITRNIFNQLLFRVDNAGATTATGVTLYVTLIEDVGGSPTLRVHQSSAFSVPANGFATVPIVVGGYAGLDTLSDMELRFEQRPTSGDLVRLEQSDTIAVDDGALVTTLATENFVRGTNGTARFTIDNSSAVQTEVVLARNAGALPSDEVRIVVEDLDGNVLSSTPVQQFTGNVLTLTNGTTVARIPAGESYTSGDIPVSVPVAAPDDVVIRLQIDQLHYRFGQSDQVDIQGVGASRETMVVETQYFGEVTSVTPNLVEVGAPSREVMISGRAIDRASATPLRDVSLKVVVSVAGFERQATVYADENGEFTYTYIPNINESGDYQVSVLHPDVQDRPVMGTFTLQSIEVRPTTFSGALVRNLDQSLNVQVSPGRATPLTNLRLEYVEADQPGSTLLAGMFVTTNAEIDVAADSAAQLNFQVRGDLSGPDNGILKLRMMADESVEPLSIITVDFTLQEAEPSLINTPSFLEMGTARDDSVVGTLTLKNQGLAALVNMNLSLTQADGTSPAPSWVSILNATTVPALDIGQEQAVEISAFPTDGITEADYEFRLKVTADNAPDRLIPVYVAVTQSGVGSVLFHTSDIYTATLDENSNVIPGLEGAVIKLQNEQVLSNLFEMSTDEFGNALFEDIPAGRYFFRASADDHEDNAGRITIQPGITDAAEVFLTNNLVTVEWSVTEITLEDRYEITLEATYKTNVPAAVVLLEPLSVNLPQLRKGEVFYGEMTLTNYGLIAAENVTSNFPTGDDYLQYEFFATPPETLGAGDIFTIPYRITALRDIDGADVGDASGGASCENHQQGASVAGDYVCANGTRLNVSASASFTASGNASQCGEPGGGGGAGGVFFSGGGGGGGTGVGYVQRTRIEGSSGGSCGGGGGDGDGCSGSEGGTQ